MTSPDSPVSPDKSGHGGNPAVKPASAAIPASSALRKALFVASLVTVVAAAAVILGLVLAPALVSSAACARLKDAGLTKPSLMVRSAGPFFASAEGITFSDGRLVSVSGAKGEVGYNPVGLLCGAPLDSASIEDAVVDVNLDAAIAAAGGSAAPLLKAPFGVPRLLAGLPARSLLVRGAKLNVSAGGTVHSMRVDALARNPENGPSAATISLTGESGDQMILSVEKEGDSDTVSAAGSFDSLGWFIACAPALGVNLPEKVGLESAPLSVQFIVKENAGRPGKWVGLVSQSWFQYENGPLMVLLQDARAGFTGESGNLLRGAAEGDLYVKAAGVSVGPFHPSVEMRGDGTLRLAADNVPVEGPRARMRIERVDLSSDLSTDKGDFTMEGTMRPSWLPATLNMAVAFPPTLDDASLTLALPRTRLDGVEIPTGWLPTFLDGARVSGGVDADIYISAGGQSAGGSSAAARLSADDALFQLPVCGLELALSGLKVRNARVSFLENGTIVELPEGLRASSAQYGAVTLTDIQMWPCRVSPEGGASVGSVTASFCGGRVITGAFRGSAAGKSGAFLLSTPFDANASGVDLAALGLTLPGRPRMEGSVDLTVKAVQQPAVTDKTALDVTTSIKSPSFRLRGIDGVDLDGDTLDATCEIRGLTTRGLGGVRLAFVRSLGITALSAPGFSFSGKAEVDGWAEASPADFLGALLKGPMHAARTNLGVNLEDASVVLSSSGIVVERISGRVGVRLGGDNPSIAPTMPLRAGRVAVGAVEMTGVRLSLSATDKGLAVGEFAGSFCGGSLLLESFVSDANGFSFRVRLEGVSARTLATLFPQFAGSLDGLLDGFVEAQWSAGTLTLKDGRLVMRASPKGRFSCKDVGAVLLGMPDLPDTARAGAANTVANMLVTDFSLTFTGNPEAPVIVHIAGSGVAGAGAAPVDSTLYPQGADKALEAALGGKIRVRFAAR
jgi:hypothetical protein